MTQVQSLWSTSSDIMRRSEQMREMGGKKTRVNREYPTLPQTGNYFCGNVRLAEPEQDVSGGLILLNKNLLAVLTSASPFLSASPVSSKFSVAIIVNVCRRGCSCSSAVGLWEAAAVVGPYRLVQ